MAAVAVTAPGLIKCRVARNVIEGWLFGNYWLQPAISCHSLHKKTNSPNRRNSAKRKQQLTSYMSTKPSPPQQLIKYTAVKIRFPIEGTAAMKLTQGKLEGVERGSVGGMDTEHMPIFLPGILERSDDPVAAGDSAPRPIAANLPFRPGITECSGVTPQLGETLDDVLAGFDRASIDKELHK
jgi:hypothetical protein